MRKERNASAPQKKINGADRPNKPPFLDLRHPLNRSLLLIRCIMPTSLDFRMGFYYSFDQVTGKLFGPNHIQVGLAGLIVHGIQVVVNEIAGRDNTYGCGRRVP
jgi:hypothetical protein